MGNHLDIIALYYSFAALPRAKNRISFYTRSGNE